MFLQPSFFHFKATIQASCLLEPANYTFEEHGALVLNIKGQGCIVTYPRSNSQLFQGVLTCYSMQDHETKLWVRTAFGEEAAKRELMKEVDALGARFLERYSVMRERMGDVMCNVVMRVLGLVSATSGEEKVIGCTVDVVRMACFMEWGWANSTSGGVLTAFQEPVIASVLQQCDVYTNMRVATDAEFDMVGELLGVDGKTARMAPTIMMAVTHKQKKCDL